MHRVAAALLVCALLTPLAGAQVKQLRWSHDPESTVYPAFVVGDLLPERPGLETILLLEAPARLRCVDAAGKAVWTQPLAGMGAFAAAPAWSPRNGLVALADDAGGVRVVEALNGAERWRDTLDAPALALLWADMEGDGTAQLAAATASGLVVWTADGARAGEVAAPGGAVTAVTALAALPTRLGGPASLFAASGATLQSVGNPGFSVDLPGPATTALAVGDTEDDSLPGVFVGTSEPAGIAAHDADLGDARWHTTLDFAPASLALGDLDRDGQAEIIVAGTDAVALLASDGSPRWTTRFDASPTPGAPTVLLCDLDSDGVLEVLVARPGAALLVFDATGRQVAERGDARPMGAPALADTTYARSLDLLYVAEGGALRALATGGFDAPSLAPWRTAGGGPARTNALAPIDPEAASPFVRETVALLANGGFEQATADGAPLDWQATGEGTLRQAGTAMNGQFALEAAPGDGVLQAESAPMVLDPALRSILVTAFAKGEGARGAMLRWLDGDRVLREDRLRRAAENAQGWRRFTTAALTRPAGADAAVLVLENGPGAGPVLWDEASAAGTLERIPHIEVHCNLLGYEEGMPKRFTVTSTVPIGGRFALIDRSGAEVYEGTLPTGERFADPFGNDWGRFHAMGDFTPHNEPGVYRLRVRNAEMEATSPEFHLRRDLLFDTTMEAAAGFLRAHRAPEGWRLPDAPAPADTAAITLALAEAHSMLRWRFNLEGAPDPFLLDEALHGAQALMAAGGDSPARAAALARVAAMAPSRDDVRAAALAALEALDGESPLRFAATVDLALLTGDPALRAQAEAQYRGIDKHNGEAILRYDELLDALDPASFDLAMALAADADQLIRAAQHPFGLHGAAVGAGQGNLFGTTADATATRGNSGAVLDAAAVVASAYRFQPRPEFVAFVYDQFNWILGNNPDGVALMTGVAKPGVVTAYAPPGGVAGGYTGRGPGDDRPLLASTAAGDPGAVTLEDTVAWIRAMAHLKRVRLGGMGG